MLSYLAWTVLVNCVIVERDCPSLLRGSAMNHRFVAACLFLTACPIQALPDDPAQIYCTNQSMIVDPVEDEQAVRIVENRDQDCVVQRNNALPGAPISEVVVFGRHGEDF